MSLRKMIVKKLTLNIALASLLLTVPFAAHAQNKLTAAEISGGWLNLFDGTSTFGWEAPQGWTVQEQMLTAPNAGDHRAVMALPFGDFVLKFDYRLNAAPSNAAVRIRAPHKGTPADSGYRIPLGDSPDWGAGGIVQRSKSSRPAPALNAWHSVTIEANGNHIVVQIDGQQTAETTDESAKAGYVEFENFPGAKLDLRSIYLMPLNANPLFNTADLSGWKSVPFAHRPGEGVGHTIEKLFGGGSNKPHLANWSVRLNAIHGELGPGSLESTNSYDDFVLQVSGTADKKKNGAFPAIYIRNDPGSVATGYAIGVGAKSGEIEGLAHPKKAVGGKATRGQAPVPETVVAGGRGIGVFINGVLETLYSDTRPEASTARAGAKLKAGAISIDMPTDLRSIDVHNVAIASTPHTFGGVVHDIPPPTPTTPIATGQSPEAIAQTAVLKTQTETILKAMGGLSSQDRQRVAQLMSQALKSQDPQQQMDLYDQVVGIDPNNSAAMQGYKEAQAKEAALQQQTQQQQTQTQTQAVNADERDRQVTDSLAAAQSSFLMGNLKDADMFLKAAEHLAPDNPLARDLRSRVDAAFSLRHRLIFLGSAAGILAILGGGALFWRMRRGVRFPVLEVVQGLDQGRVYPVDRDVVRIGGIAQDGGQKNDIVVRDVEHMVSRFHCQVRKKEGNIYLVDTNSSNGTKVNGTIAMPNQPILLRKGSKIALGGSTVLQLGFIKKQASSSSQTGARQA